MHPDVCLYKKMKQDMKASEVRSKMKDEEGEKSEDGHS